MNRLSTIYIIFFMIILFLPIDAAMKRKTYTTGIFDIVRVVIRHSVNRLIFRDTSYESDVFRYTQLSRRSSGGLYAGESCRLSSVICSYDDHCCSGRCLCRRWTITGEERCTRKCF